MMKPDPNSNSQVQDGRRLVPSSSGRGYFIVNYGSYRSIKTAEEKKAYMRDYMQRYRKAKNTNDVTSVNNCKSPLGLLAHAEGEGEAEGEATPTPSESATPNSSAPKSGVSEGKENGNLPTTEQSRRIASLFRRRLTTPWTAKEIAAYKKIGTLDPRDLAALEKYYGSNWPPCLHKNILRHDLVTLLGNIAGEIDRAHGENGKHSAPAGTRNNPLL